MPFTKVKIITDTVTKEFQWNEILYILNQVSYCAHVKKKDTPTSSTSTFITPSHILKNRYISISYQKSYDIELEVS